MKNKMISRNEVKQIIQDLIAAARKKTNKDFQLEDKILTVGQQ